MKIIYPVLLTVGLLTGCSEMTQIDCVEKNATFLYNGSCTDMKDIPAKDQERILMEYVNEKAEIEGMTRDEVLTEMHKIMESVE